MIEFAGLTYGCELEMGDIDTQIHIPSKLGKYDYHDSSICNSNGTANDPKKILNRYGSEIQVKPTTTADALVDRVLEIYSLFPKIDFNFTTNFHVHVMVPGLKEDLKSLKKIAVYLNTFGQSMFDLVDPIPVPKPSDFSSDKKFEGAKKRYLRRKNSHHHNYSDRMITKILEAKTVEQFHLAHAPKDKNGKPQWHLVMRNGVNLAHIWKPTETIEFRCFTMTRDPIKLMSAIRWSRLLLKAALFTNDPPDYIVGKRKLGLFFQKFYPYKYHQDRIFQLTNVRHNSRKVATENYKSLITNGWINEKELH